MDSVNITGRRLYELRKERGFTQKDVAKMIGVAETSYKAWENGDYKRKTVYKNGRKTRKNMIDKKSVNIGSRYIAALADLYGVSCDYLLNRSDYKAIDGAAIAKKTGLSDGALSALDRYGTSAMYNLSSVVSDLIEDYAENKENSVLYLIGKYSHTLPDTFINVSLNTGHEVKDAGPFPGSEINVGSAILFQTVGAMEKYRSNLLSKKHAIETD